MVAGGTGKPRGREKGKERRWVGGKETEREKERERERERDAATRVQAATLRATT